MLTEYVGVEDIARRFGVQCRTITAWRKRLGMPYLRMSKGKRGGLVLFRIEEVEQWASQFTGRAILARQKGGPK